MKRKVIKLASNTLVISLPSKWAKQHGIKKGDEIHLEEKEGNLVINSSSVPARAKTEINVADMKPLIFRALGALYKKGYEEFTVYFENPEEFKLAHDVVREEFVGFDVIHHGKSHLVISEISKPQEEQFEAALRRLFLLIKDFASETFTALNNTDYPWLGQLVLRDKDVNKISDFCRRLVNKRQHSTSTGLYFIVEQLEKISDRYRDICNYASHHHHTPSKTMLSLYKEVNSYFEYFYNCFYKFDLKKINKFVKIRKELLASIQKAQEQAAPVERRILFWLEDITEKVFDLNGPLMLIKL